MKTVSEDTCINRTASVLDTVQNPGGVPEGAPGSVMRRAWNIGRAFSESQRNARIAVASLHKIACWDEGTEVTGSFDEPGSAAEARQALAKLGIKGPPQTKKVTP